MVLGSDSLARRGRTEGLWQPADPVTEHANVVFRGGAAEAVTEGMMVAMLTGGHHEIRLRGWRRVAYRLLRPAPIKNIVGWLDCSVPGARGRLRKLLEPWRWHQA